MSSGAAVRSRLSSVGPRNREFPKLRSPAGLRLLVHKVANFQNYSLLPNHPLWWRAMSLEVWTRSDRSRDGLSVADFQRTARPAFEAAIQASLAATRILTVGATPFNRRNWATFRYRAPTVRCYVDSRTSHCSAAAGGILDTRDCPPFLLGLGGHVRTRHPPVSTHRRAASPRSCFPVAS